MTDDAPNPSPTLGDRARAAGRMAVAVFSSYGTVCIILLLLMLLTFFGTLEQKYTNIYDVQAKYFESFFVLASMGSIKIPLPGATLLLGLLAVCLLVGGIVRMRWTASRVGILIIHMGMLLMLIGGFIEFMWSTKGYLPLAEQEDFLDTNDNGRWDPDERFADYDNNKTWTPGESADYFLSYYLHDFVLVRHGQPPREFLLPYEQVARADEQRVQFTHPELPFTVAIEGFSRNSVPERVAPGAHVGVRGLKLKRLDPDPEKAERHRPGFYASLHPLKGGAAVREILWSGQRHPARVEVAGQRWDLELRTRRFPLPFRLQLNDAVQVRLPGTSMAKEYSSHVTKIENQLEDRRHITMNEPLRHRGFTFYQSGYQEFPRGPDLSTLAVVENPADKIPLIACLVIAAGLLIHFVRKLTQHLEYQRRRRATS